MLYTIQHKYQLNGSDGTKEVGCVGKARSTNPHVVIILNNPRKSGFLEIFNVHT